MIEPEKIIAGSERLTGVFGYWPSFHDAEVIDFHLWRGDVEPEAGRYVFPVLTTKFHLWELTREVDAHGYLVTRHHTLATLRFHDLHQFRMDGFDHQNQIYGLGITAEEPQVGVPALLRVEFEAASSMTATFHCTRIEVLQAEPFSSSTRTA